MRQARRVTKCRSAGVLAGLDRWDTRRHANPDMSKDGLTAIFHTCVAADVSRRHLRCEKNAPTDVGGYTLSVNRAECEISRLSGPGNKSCDVSWTGTARVLKPTMGLALREPRVSSSGGFGAHNLLAIRGVALIWCQQARKPKGILWVFSGYSRGGFRVPTGCLPDGLGVASGWLQGGRKPLTKAHTARKTARYKRAGS